MGGIGEGGGDIGCGMAALRFDVDADALADERLAARLLEEIRALAPPQAAGR